MPFREQTIGALNLFRLPDERLSETDLQLGQALADVATIAVLEHRTIAASERTAAQLQAALNSRIAVEQAKGVIAEHAGVTMDAAFELRRSYARETRPLLSTVASEIATGQLSPGSGTQRPDGRRTGT